MIDHYGSKVRLKFNKSYLKQANKITYDYRHRVNIYIVHELGASGSNNNDPTLKNCLFGAMEQIVTYLLMVQKSTNLKQRIPEL